MLCKISCVKIISLPQKLIYILVMLTDEEIFSSSGSKQQQPALKVRAFSFNTGFSERATCNNWAVIFFIEKWQFTHQLTRYKTLINLNCNFDSIMFQVISCLRLYFRPRVLEESLNWWHETERLRNEDRRVIGHFVSNENRRVPFSQRSYGIWWTRLLLWPSCWEAWLHVAKNTRQSRVFFWVRLAIHDICS